MAYYDLYHNAPGWGTSGYHFSTPPMPSYQPQPTWRGQDYFRAHGGYNDPSMYNYAYNRINDHPGAGVGLEEARHWHRRAYGGMGDVRLMLPPDIGSAAAYEVWRNWKSHYGVYAQPLAGDSDRQREALVGLAVGEAARLWQYTGRTSDSYGRLEASEIAAGTVSRILSQSMSFGDDYDGYNSLNGYNQLSRRNSAVSLRSMSRGRSLSRAGTPFDGGMYGTAGSMYDNGSVYGGAGGVYNGGGSMYGGAGSAYGDVLDPSYETGALMRRRSYSALGSGGYAATPVAVPASMTPSISYAQQPMSYAGSSYGYPAQSQGYAPGYASTPSVTVVQAPSSHRHRSHSRHRSSRSSRHRHRHGSHSSSYYVANTVPYGY